MTALGYFPLQKAVYQALAGDATLMGLVTGVYDRPPQGAAFPYISFAQWQAADWSSASSAGVAVYPVLDIWSRQGGHKQAAVLMERVQVLLHDAALAVDGFALVMLRVTDSSVSLLDDGSTYHGVMRLKALLEAV